VDRAGWWKKGRKMVPGKKRQKLEKRREQELVAMKKQEKYQQKEGEKLELVVRVLGKHEFWWVD